MDLSKDSTRVPRISTRLDKTVAFSPEKKQKVAVKHGDCEEACEEVHVVNGNMYVINISCEAGGNFSFLNGGFTTELAAGTKKEED